MDKNNSTVFSQFNKSSNLWKYAEAVEAYEAFLDSMDITDSQRLLLKSTYHYLENLQGMMLMEEDALDQPNRMADSNGFISQKDHHEGHRSVKGKDIIDWIDDNALVEADISCIEDSLRVTMIDADDSSHIRQLRLSWAVERDMYEIVDNRLQSN